MGDRATNLTDSAAVSQQELHGSGMHGIHGLCNVDDIQLTSPPQQIVLTQVTVHQHAVLVQGPHVLHTHTQEGSVKQIIKYTTDYKK